MRIQLTPTIRLWYGLGRSKIHHVERPTRSQVWSTAACHRAKAVIGAGEHTSEKEVADFGGGDVEHAANVAVLQKSFHRLAARTGGVKHQAIEARSKQPDHL